jgi:hypothetical protein
MNPIGSNTQKAIVTSVGIENHSINPCAVISDGITQIHASLAANLEINL